MTQASNVKRQGTSLASDFETFLKMLTAQAKYQDPLNPLDSAEYASQLAQFSSVEQAVRTNELLTQIAGQSTSQDMSALASWLGREVLSASSRLYEGAPLTLHSTATGDGATAAELVAYNEDGDQVYRASIDPAVKKIEWTGRDALGADLPHGTYEFRIERYSGETLLSKKMAQSFVPVSEVRVTSGQPYLHLESGTVVKPADVTAVR
jgi:flagellar basal-body rod modification protein FlgD